MGQEVLIIIPEKLYVLRDKKNQDICVDKEEYTIYYQNIIYPYSEEYDVQIECAYGKNLGSCWRIDQFEDDVAGFPLAIRVYKTFGELVAEKQCQVKILDKEETEAIKLLCIGDSMTRSEIYIQHAVNKARNVDTVGLRNISYGVNHEGRGGWKSYDFLERYADTGNGVSPFLFPEECGGKEYFGDKAYWERIESSEYYGKYSYSGIKPQYIREGMTCLDKGVLYRYQNGSFHKENENPTFAFDFQKYIERYEIEKPDIVSLLFGANEFQICSYDELQGELVKFIDALNRIILSIKAYDPQIKIIVNMPVGGGDQFAWGNALGCVSSSKQYNYCIKMASKAILETFENRETDGIFVCPMLAVCDTNAGFPWEFNKSNIYSDKSEIHCSNWVHPSKVGYQQMGDALAAVIVNIKKQRG